MKWCCWSWWTDENMFLFFEICRSSQEPSCLRVCPLVALNESYGVGKPQSRGLDRRKRDLLVKRWPLTCIQQLFDSPHRLFLLAACSHAGTSPTHIYCHGRMGWPRPMLEPGGRRVAQNAESDWKYRYITAHCSACVSDGREVCVASLRGSWSRSRAFFHLLFPASHHPLWTRAVW